ncbi:MAG: cyclase family protein [Gammaproteobacteria bacterium]|nr:cyclase family protein [Gammaproteobacteria bacterium]NNF59761.1 cyclase family protein [Gammaproteobacteria bacterium]NNM20955.1 cyclase family protein [Gammaproteobacteria bacterium]
MSSLVDLSHRIVSGVQTYPGLPAPIVDAYLSHQDSRPHYTDGTEFQIGHIEMVMNTATYVDSPFHRFREKPDIAALPLHRLADLEAVCIHTHGACLDVAALHGLDLRNKAVLIHTGWSQHWGTPHYFENHPFVTRDAAQWLADKEVKHVGIDSLNIDCIKDGTRPAHTILLGAGIPITEHLADLGALPDAGFRYFAVPVKVVGAGSFPVRAFAIIP